MRSTAVLAVASAAATVVAGRHAPLPGNVCRNSLLQSRKGISEIEGKAARVAASEREQRTSFNSLRTDDRVSAHERHRSTGKPRAIGAKAENDCCSKRESVTTAPARWRRCKIRSGGH